MEDKVSELENHALFKCAICPYSTKTSINYKRHLKTHEIKKLFKCPECPFKSKREGNLKQHVKNIHQDQSRQFRCSHPGCNYASKYKQNLTVHAKIHSDEKSFFCLQPNCNFSTKYKQCLIKHTQTHTEEKPFVCPFESCSYATAAQGNLVVHLRIHTKEKPYKCPQPNCEYSAISNSHLKQHQLIHGPKEGEVRRSFPCPIELCAYEGKSKTHLSSHMIGHSLEKPFACSFESCEFRCKTKYRLENHLKSHSEKRQYKCELCPYRAKTRSVVSGHVQTAHSDPNFRPFKCSEPQCVAAFKLKGPLMQHLLIHQGDLKFSCSFPVCDFRAIKKSQVKSHEYNIHSDEKKAKCTICDYKCKRRADLMSHIRTHTKEEPYKCKEEGCQYRAKTSAGLSKHKQRKHPLILNLGNW